MKRQSTGFVCTVYRIANVQKKLILNQSKLRMLLLLEKKAKPLDFITKCGV